MKECLAGEKCPDKARCMAIMRKAAKRRNEVQAIAKARKAESVRTA